MLSGLVSEPVVRNCEHDTCCVGLPLQSDSCWQIHCMQTKEASMSDFVQDSGYTGQNPHILQLGCSFQQFMVNVACSQAWLLHARHVRSGGQTSMSVMANLLPDWAEV